jgi:hypothetical protein
VDQFTAHFISLFCHKVTSVSCPLIISPNFLDFGAVTKPLSDVVYDVNPAVIEVVLTRYPGMLDSDFIFPDSNVVLVHAIVHDKQFEGDVDVIMALAEGIENKNFRSFTALGVGNFKDILGIVGRGFFFVVDLVFLSFQQLGKSTNNASIPMKILIDGDYNIWKQHKIDFVEPSFHVSIILLARDKLCEEERIECVDVVAGELVVVIHSFLDVILYEEVYHGIVDPVVIVESFEVILRYRKHLVIVKLVAEGRSEFGRGFCFFNRFQDIHLVVGRRPSFPS